MAEKPSVSQVTVGSSEHDCQDVKVWDSFDHAHRQTHKGLFFEMGHYFSLAASGIAEIVLELTAGSIDHHADFRVGSTADVKLELIQISTYTSLGTSLTAHNNKVNAGTAASGGYYHSPSSMTGSAIAPPTLIPAGSGRYAGGGIGGGAVRAGTEKIMTRGYNYGLRLTNLSGSSGITVSMHAAWYEQNVS